MSFEFALKNTDERARRGTMKTLHGLVETPVFMPVGTTGAMKGLLSRDLMNMGAEIILANTYHLWLRPGLETLKTVGGVRSWSQWPRALLTDSGGFQVFSLAKLRKITEEGVEFQNHLDGLRALLTPELSVELQEAIGASIMMILDVCPALPATKEDLLKACSQTTRWASRALKARKTEAALFGIVQGGLDAEIRLQHLEEIVSLEVDGKSFDGFALGGLSVGEKPEDMYELLKKVAHKMPEQKPRYLMGVGTPWDLLEAVGQGIDMFDCVMPTRNARNGMLFTSRGIVRIHKEEHSRSREVLDPECDCFTCKNYELSYLRHLYHAGELNAAILGSMHNVHFYLSVMKNTRHAIENGTFATFKRQSFKSWGREEKQLNTL